MTKTSTFAPATLLTLAGALALSACGEAEEKSYEADATDESGGDFIISEPDPAAVPVDLPETEMTEVPPEDEMADDAMAEMPAEAPAE
ncbi:hypothetical protein [Altererythrobacter sp. ZODW24]|uniref:hypothetical protein n=1 Tax=Altererythrobacter sp. ZODW24 TaxID=2185142 RepID=UPI000DF7C5E2|nr:hypothetical protein [Altererythrobacter sp. ZODW24]